MGPKGKPLKGYIDRYGYHCVTLWNRCTMKSDSVHRLTAGAFLGPIPKGMQVNHKNGIRTDNRLANLEIVTPSDNVRHSFRVLNRIGKNTNPSKGEAHHHSSLTADKVREIRKLYSDGWTQVRLAARFETQQTNISMIVRRRAWRHVAD